MDGDSTNVVGMGLKRGNLLRGVVVVYSHLEVIGAANNPILSGDESTGTHGDICELKGLDDLLSFIGPDVNVAYPCQLRRPPGTARLTYRCRVW